MRGSASLNVVKFSASYTNARGVSAWGGRARASVAQKTEEGPAQEGPPWLKTRSNVNDSSRACISGACEVVASGDIRL